MYKSLFKILSLCLLGICTLGAGPCGYKIVGNGSSLPKNIHTIAIKTFQNESLRYRVEQKFTKAVADEILRRRLPVTLINDTVHADAVITGSIRNFGFRGVLVDNSGRTRLYEITITASATLRDQTNNQILFNDQHLQFRGEYQLSEDPASFFNEEDPAVERIARDFARNLLTTMTEGF